VLIASLTNPFSFSLRNSYVQDTFIDLLLKNGISFPGTSCCLDYECCLHPFICHSPTPSSGYANSCAMQPISEIPFFFAKQFAQLCGSVSKSGVKEIRSVNIKDSARFLVEDVLSGFPDLVPTDAFEVSSYQSRFFVMFCETRH
jgi:hypothetical protein